MQKKEKTIIDQATDILNDVKESRQKFDKKDIDDNKGMAILAYVFPPIPYIIEHKSKWVRYHAIQGINLFIIVIILSIFITVINTIIPFSFTYLNVLLRTFLGAFTAILIIIGIINVCNGEAKELPIINKYKLIKK